MQDKDTEAINNQRKRRKRIGRIRNGIIMTIAGWIILSIILIIVLFLQVIKIQHKLARFSSSEIPVAGGVTDS